MVVVLCAAACLDSEVKMARVSVAVPMIGLGSCVFFNLVCTECTVGGKMQPLMGKLTLKR